MKKGKYFAYLSKDENDEQFHEYPTLADVESDIYDYLDTQGEEPGIVRVVKGVELKITFPVGLKIEESKNATKSTTDKD